MADMRDLITVVMPTSPIPSNPSTDVIEQTIESVRAQEDLANCEIIVAFDGVRPQQIEQRKKSYEIYKDRLLWKINHEMDNVLPLVLPLWGHQANSVRAALHVVQTPLILFMEHDTPICNKFDWDALTRACQDDRVNTIRFHFEAQIHPEHAYLNVRPTEGVQDICGAPLVAVAQWSQRPHLSKTNFYRGILLKYFGIDSRTMIEDVIHGVLQQAFQEHGEEGWEQFKLWLYHPGEPGTIKRSEHLDGREGDPKFDMYYEYPEHETPWGAPARTAGRVD